MEKEEGQDQRASDTATTTSPDKKDKTTEEPKNPKKQFQKIKQEEIRKIMIMVVIQGNSNPRSLEAKTS